MDSPAGRRLDELMRRIFPGPDGHGAEDAADGSAEPDVVAGVTSEPAAPLRGVDERRQRLLEPLGDPDRESW